MPQITVMIRQDPTCKYDATTEERPILGAWLKDKEVYDVVVEVPHGGLDGFMTDLGNFVDRNMPSSRWVMVPELGMVVLLVPYSMSWDPAIRIRDWVSERQMESERV